MGLREPGGRWGGLDQPAVARQIAAPTLVIAGDLDPIVPARNAHILARHIPTAQLHLVHGAGHLLLLDQPDHCARLIADLLQAPGRDQGAPPVFGLSR